jgi:hypothetical protein
MSGPSGPCSDPGCDADSGSDSSDMRTGTPPPGLRRQRRGPAPHPPRAGSR